MRRMSSVDTQSPDIAMGVDTGGAGDQGLMFGYATNESPELMPLPILLAHKLTQRLADVAARGDARFLRPDGKSQVSVEYDGRQARSHRYCRHFHPTRSREVTTAQLREEILEHIIKPTFPARFSIPKRNTTSIRPDASWSADLKAIAV